MASVTKPIILDETGKDIANALWAIAAGQGSIDYARMKQIIVNGGGKRFFPVGTVVKVEDKADNSIVYDFVFVHHGQYADGRYYAILRMMSGQFNLVFDATEAFYYSESGLTAGTYYFTVPTTVGNAAEGNYEFTLTQNLPAKGRLVLTGDVVNDGFTYVDSYGSPSATTRTERVSISTGNSGTFLGELKANGDTVNGINDIQRSTRGNANYAQSNIRRFLISSAAAGSVWVSSELYDMSPSWNSAYAGFLTHMPDDFVAILSESDFVTKTNTLYEVGDYSTNSSYTLRDKFFLPSLYNIFGTPDSGLNEIQWDYYVGSTATDKILFDTGGVARNQLLRSPQIMSTYGVEAVSDTGNSTGLRAYWGGIVAPACVID